MPLMSQRQYALHRKTKGLSGATHMAVAKAIKSGRIRANAKGQVDSEKADIAWAAHTDVGRITSDGKGNMAGEITGGSGGGAQAAASPFQQARTVREISTAQLVKMKLDKEQGKLVTLEVVKASVENVVAITRTKLLALPHKIKQQMPHIETADIKAIDALLRAAMVEMVEGLENAPALKQPPAGA